MAATTRALVEFCHCLQYKNLGLKAVEQTRHLLLDYLGVAVGGSQMESSQAVYRMLENSAANGPCTVLGTAMHAAPGNAALANGTASHGVELDDTHQAGSIHLGVVMFSTAIALSETLPGISAEQFIPAVVAGYEVAARLGMALQPKYHYELGFHPTATCGVFGAAVTAAKLMGLSEEQMLFAVGIAGSMAAGSLEFLADGAWTKRLHPGLAAQNGILAANLAASGFRGPRTIIEGRDGFLSGYSRKPLPNVVTKNLGKTYEILHTAVKPHACCRYMQSPIDGLIELARKNDIHPDEVQRVEVAVLRAGWPLVCEPRKRKYAPENTVDAQFSMPFGAAIALTYRDASLDQFTGGAFHLPKIRKLMAKVVLEKNDLIEKKFPVEWATIVKVRLKNGKEFNKHVRFPRGDPENPLTWEELSQKFRSLAGRVLSPGQCDQIIRRVSRIESSAPLREIWKLAARAVPAEPLAAR